MKKSDTPERHRRAVLEQAMRKALAGLETYVTEAWQPVDDQCFEILPDEPPELCAPPDTARLRRSSR
jgi:hypothetical protein